MPAAMVLAANTFFQESRGAPAVYEVEAVSALRDELDARPLSRDTRAPSHMDVMEEPLACEPSCGSRPCNSWAAGATLPQPGTLSPEVAPTPAVEKAATYLPVEYPADYPSSRRTGPPPTVVSRTNLQTTPVEGAARKAPIWRRVSQTVTPSRKQRAVEERDRRPQVAIWRPSGPVGLLNPDHVQPGWGVPSTLRTPNDWREAGRALHAGVEEQRHGVLTHRLEDVLTRNALGHPAWREAAPVAQQLRARLRPPGRAGRAPTGAIVDRSNVDKSTVDRSSRADATDSAAVTTKSTARCSARRGGFGVEGFEGVVRQAIQQSKTVGPPATESGHAQDEAAPTTPRTSTSSRQRARWSALRVSRALRLATARPSAEAGASTLNYATSCRSLAASHRDSMPSCRDSMDSHRASATEAGEGFGGQNVRRSAPSRVRWQTGGARAIVQPTSCECAAQQRLGAADARLPGSSAHERVSCLPEEYPARSRVSFQPGLSCQGGEPASSRNVPDTLDALMDEERLENECRT